jgi:hypothetical protein
MTPTISQSLNILIVDDEINIRKTVSVKPFTPAQVNLAVNRVSEMRTLEQRVA